MPMNLGAIIDILRSMPQNANVFFDFGNIEPTVLTSYRGYYDHLALGYQEERALTEGVKVAALLSECEQATGRTYEGWKGGNYTMSRLTPVWVANRGRANSTAIVSIREVGYGVVIDARFED